MNIYCSSNSDSLERQAVSRWENEGGSIVVPRPSGERSLSLPLARGTCDDEEDDVHERNAPWLPNTPIWIDCTPC
jgi:hypothetical protein